MDCLRESLVSYNLSDEHPSNVSQLKAKAHILPDDLLTGNFPLVFWVEDMERAVSLQILWTSFASLSFRLHTDGVRLLHDINWCTDCTKLWRKGCSQTGKNISPFKHIQFRVRTAEFETEWKSAVMTRKDNRLRISAIESCECLALNNE
jgi:hypothetical protein